MDIYEPNLFPGRNNLLGAVARSRTAQTISRGSITGSNRFLTSPLRPDRLWNRPGSWYDEQCRLVRSCAADRPVHLVLGLKLSGDISPLLHTSSRHAQV